MLNDFRAPSLSLRFIPVWRRNFLVWRKLAIPAILGNLADPMIYMLGLGYGIGTLLPQVGGVSYIAYLAAGAMCFSTLNSASFEALYSAFSRMQVQKTWDAILNAPMALDDLMLAELTWTASKASLSGLAILGISAVLGLVASPLALWTLPLIFLTGLVFAALGLLMTTLAPNYDFFMYYFTLFVTPMTLLSGVFFPVEQLPLVFQQFSALLPLSHAVHLTRPLFLGEWPAHAWQHVGVLVAYCVIGFWLALGVARRRLLK